MLQGAPHGARAASVAPSGAVAAACWSRSGEGSGRRSHHSTGRPRPTNMRLRCGRAFGRWGRYGFPWRRLWMRRSGAQWSRMYYPREVRELVQTVGTDLPDVVRALGCSMSRNSSGAPEISRQRKGFDGHWKIAVPRPPSHNDSFPFLPTGEAARAAPMEPLGAPSPGSVLLMCLRLHRFRCLPQKLQFGDFGGGCHEGSPSPRRGRKPEERRVRCARLRHAWFLGR